MGMGAGMSERIAGTHFPGYSTHPKASATVCAVCVDGAQPGQRPSYAVYMALVPENCSGRELSGKDLERVRAEAIAWTMARGTKLTHKQALFHFPSLKAEDYRA